MNLAHRLWFALIFVDYLLLTFTFCDAKLKKGRETGRLTLIGMREALSTPLSFLDHILSAEFLSKNSKHFWRWKLTSIGLSKGFWAGPAMRKVVKMKKKIFPAGLQVHLEDMFWVYKLFAEILSWAEQSGTQFFRGSNLLLVWSSCAAIRFQLFDIWWSSLDKIDDFKAISRVVFFRFGEIINIMILSFVKKIFFDFFLNSL